MSLTAHGTPPPRTASQTSARAYTAASADTGVLVWLGGVIALIFAMVVVGGATRLTDSGLSITEWLPILGVVPPLTDADWQAAFDKYRQIPEYQEVNRGMSMADFQFIYWWEWAHRFLGRVIGIAFAVPLVVFLIQRRIPTRMIPWMVGLLLLGGLQGFVGWYMVQSGLVDRVDVSQYRLALHLSIAFLILGLLVWCFLTLARRTQPVTLTTLSSRTLVIAGGLLALVFAQVALGAFVAGTKAGVNYNTWPLMDGEFVPAGLFDMTPLWINAVENVTMIQFNHRMTAYLLVIAVTVHAAIVWRRTDAHDAANSALALAVAVWLQAVTGIWTLLAAEGAIPIGLGLVHQGGAAIVLTIAVWHWHAVWRDVVHRPANLWRAA